MKRKIVALMAVLALVLAIPSYAVSARFEQVFPSLEFSGTTATCAVTVRGNNASDKITATIRLAQGGRTVERWTANGTGVLEFEETASVTKGETYLLLVDATINGEDLPTASVTKTCK